MFFFQLYYYTLILNNYYKFDLCHFVCFYKGLCYNFSESPLKVSENSPAF